MVNEIKQIFKNVSSFRRLLKESAGESIIKDAIGDKEYLYLYYKGDGVESKGNRVVKPFIMGTRKTKRDADGNELDQPISVKVFRGWQISGDSDSQHRQIPGSGKPRKGHERFNDQNLNKEVAGWREFRLDRVLSVYPTGNTFKTDKLPKPYKGNMDKVITSVDIAIPKSYQPEPKPVRDVLASKFLRDPNIGRKIENLFVTVKKVKKRSPNKTYVYVNKQGDLRFTYSEDFVKNKLPKEKLLGNLRDLYNKHVLPEKSRSDNFLDMQIKDSQRYVD